MFLNKTYVINARTQFREGLDTYKSCKTKNLCWMTVSFGSITLNSVKEITARAQRHFHVNTACCGIQKCTFQLCHAKKKPPCAHDGGMVVSTVASQLEGQGLNPGLSVWSLESIVWTLPLAL